MLHTHSNDSPNPTGEQEMSLHPTMAQAMWFAPPASSVHRHPSEACGTYTLNEPARIAADLKRNEDKNSGKLLRDEVDRAHAREVAEGVHSHG